MMTGVKSLFRATQRRHDLAAEIYNLKGSHRLLTLEDTIEVRNRHFAEVAPYPTLSFTRPTIRPRVGHDEC